MRKHVVRHFGFLKTTLLGGVVFLLPLIVVGALLAQAGQIVWGVVETLRKNDDFTAYVPVHTPMGYAALVAASIGVLIGLCFVCGVLARRSLGRWFTEKAERYLTMLFPRYAVFKDQLTGNLGGGTLKPLLAKIGPSTRIGMEVERDAHGNVTVYLPSAPDPWSGTVEIVSERDVSPISAEYIDVMTSFEQLGRGTARFVARAAEAGRAGSGD